LYCSVLLTRTLALNNYEKNNLFLRAIFILYALLCSKCCPKIKIDRKAESLESKVITWRKFFHQNPELGNKEFKTAPKNLKHLRSLGIEVLRTGVAKRVVGI
jgi:hypothetical protein